MPSFVKIGTLVQNMRGDTKNGNFISLLSFLKQKEKEAIINRKYVGIMTMKRDWSHLLRNVVYIRYINFQHIIQYYKQLNALKHESECLAFEL
jgi:hypothetical protein